MSEDFSHRFGARFAQDPPDSSVAEMHGILSGMLCSDPGLDCDDWLETVFAEDCRKLSEADRATLATLFETTRVDLASPDLTFELLLPDDEEPLTERTRALGHWCQGFLFGLGQSVGNRQWSDEADEVLHDLAEISRIESEGSTAEDEEAYAEIEEYVRMAVQLIRSDFEPGHPPLQRLH